MPALVVFEPWGDLDIRRASVNTQTVLIIASISGLIVIIGLVKFFKNQATKKLNRRVDAIITEIRVEASSISSWWTITAVWSDPQTGQTLTFRSSHIRYPPKQHVGEHITVNYEATNPKHCRMEL
jgi:hypothetical protein